jgi:hypothetical protein
MDTLLRRVAALETALRGVQSERQALERRERLTRRRLLFCQAVIAAVIISGLLLAPAGRVAAQGNGLAARVAALEAAVASLQTQVGNLQKALNNETAARQSADAALQNGVAAETAARQAADANLQNQVDPLTAKLSHFSIDTIDGYYSVVLTGANFHIRNGLGATNGNPANPFFGPSMTNGLGNVIIGYNERRFGGMDRRAGSHNAVIGTFQNFSSFGGLVAGFENEISGRYASVSGGDLNTSSGDFASISGGFANTASGLQAAVSGGESNVASALQSSVSGGANNSASGPEASVSGGSGNSASGGLASVSGGAGLTAGDPFGWAAGQFHSP